MTQPQPRLKYGELTAQIIKAFYEVYNRLGYGFLEKVYENALVVQLQRAGLRAEQQVPLKVYYDGVIVGDYFADVVVEGKVILELKVADCLDAAHKTQLRNYLRATECEIGLVLNFGPEPTFVRQILEKQHRSSDLSS